MNPLICNPLYPQNAITVFKIFFSLVLRIQQDPVKAAGFPNTKLQNVSSDKTACELSRMNNEILIRFSSRRETHF